MSFRLIPLLVISLGVALATLALRHDCWDANSGNDEDALIEFIGPVVERCAMDPKKRYLFATDGSYIYEVRLSDYQVRTIPFRADVIEYLGCRETTDFLFPGMAILKRPYLLDVSFYDRSRLGKFYATIDPDMAFTTACVALPWNATRILTGKKYLAVTYVLEQRVRTVILNIENGLVRSKYVLSLDDLGPILPCSWIDAKTCLCRWYPEKKPNTELGIAVVDIETRTVNRLSLPTKSNGRGKARAIRYLKDARLVIVGLTGDDSSRTAFYSLNKNGRGEWRLRIITEIDCSVYKGTIACSRDGKRVVFACRHGFYKLELPENRILKLCGFVSPRRTEKAERLARRWGPLVLIMHASKYHYVHAAFIDRWRVLAVQQNGKIDIWNVMTSKIIESTSGLQLAMKNNLRVSSD